MMRPDGGPSGKKPPIGPKPQTGTSGAPQLEVVGQAHGADSRSSSLMQLSNSPRKSSISDNGFGPLRPRSPKPSEVVAAARDFLDTEGRGLKQIRINTGGQVGALSSGPPSPVSSPARRRAVSSIGPGTSSMSPVMSPGAASILSSHSFRPLQGHSRLQHEGYQPQLTMDGPHAVPLPPTGSPLPSRKVNSAPDSQSYAMSQSAASHGHNAPWRPSEALQGQQQQQNPSLYPSVVQQLWQESLSPPSPDCNSPTVHDEPQGMFGGGYPLPPAPIPSRGSFLGSGNGRNALLVNAAAAVLASERGSPHSPPTPGSVPHTPSGSSLKPRPPGEPSNLGGAAGPGSRSGRRPSLIFNSPDQQQFQRISRGPSSGTANNAGQGACSPCDEPTSRTHSGNLGVQPSLSPSALYRGLQPQGSGGLQPQSSGGLPPNSPPLPNYIGSNLGPAAGISSPSFSGGSASGPLQMGGSLAGTPSSRPSSGRMRPVQMLADVVRSKDEGKVAEMIEYLRGPQGNVMGLNDRHELASCTPLHMAVVSVCPAIVATLLTAGASPDIGHPTQGPPLLHAAAFGDMPCLDLLLEAGVDVRLADDSGDTALHHACRGSHIDAARALVRYGADMRCRNADNQAPFDLASPEMLKMLMTAAVEAATPGFSATLIRRALARLPGTPGEALERTDTSSSSSRHQQQQYQEQQRQQHGYSSQVPTLSMLPPPQFGVPLSGMSPQGGPSSNRSTASSSSGYVHGQYAAGSVAHIGQGQGPGQGQGQGHSIAASLAVKGPPPVGSLPAGPAGILRTRRNSRSIDEAAAEGSPPPAGPPPAPLPSYTSPPPAGMPAPTPPSPLSDTESGPPPPPTLQLPRGVQRQLSRGAVMADIISYYQQEDEDIVRKSPPPSENAAGGFSGAVHEQVAKAGVPRAPLGSAGGDSNAASGFAVDDTLGTAAAHVPPRPISGAGGMRSRPGSAGQGAVPITPHEAAFAAAVPQQPRFRFGADINFNPPTADSPGVAGGMRHGNPPPQPERLDSNLPQPQAGIGFTPPAGVICPPFIPAASSGMVMQQVQAPQQAQPAQPDENAAGGGGGGEDEHQRLRRFSTSRLTDDGLAVSDDLATACPPLMKDCSPHTSPRASAAGNAAMGQNAGQGQSGSGSAGGGPGLPRPSGTTVRGGSSRALQDAPGERQGGRLAAATAALARRSAGSSQEAIAVRAAALFGRSLEVTTGTMMWTRGEQLGQGAYGSVYAGLNQRTGELMAVKVQEVITKPGRAESQLGALKSELDLYKRLQHKNIVGYIDSQFDTLTSTLYIFLEYVPGGSISSMLERFGRFSESLVRNYTRQLLLGLEYLHSQRIVHRDLKGGNVLISRDAVVKLADFGASKSYSDATITDCMKSIRGSVFWMAPEIIRGTGYGWRADIWSLGCTVIEMLTGKHPWPNLGGPQGNQLTAMFAIAKTAEGPPRPQTVSPEALDFLNICLSQEPRDRPSCTDLLKHPWVAQ